MNASAIVTAPRTFNTICRVTALLFAGGVVVQSLQLSALRLPHELTRFLRLDAAWSLPSLWAAVLLLLAAGMFLRIARRPPCRTRRIDWFLLATLFTMLSLDAVFGLHKRLSDPVSALLGIEGRPQAAWVLPGIVAVFLLASHLAPWFQGLPLTARGRLSAAATLFLLGAVGVDSIGGWLASLGAHRGLLVSLVCVEEGLELFGVILLLSVLIELDRRPPNKTPVRPCIT